MRERATFAFLHPLAANLFHLVEIQHHPWFNSNIKGVLLASNTQGCIVRFPNKIRAVATKVFEVRRLEDGNGAAIVKVYGTHSNTLISPVNQYNIEA